jgi:hypothetical protein
MLGRLDGPPARGDVRDPMSYNLGMADKAQ